jgi:uncharacterized protein DUF6644
MPSAMSLLPFCQWLAETPWSIRLHESLYGYPLVESTHFWMLALFVGFTVMLDLRLLGWVMRRVPVSEVAQRLLPWMRVSFGLMVLTGLALFYAIPVRSYQNVFFRVKMVLLVIAGVNVFVFHSGIFKRVTSWDRDVKPPPRARLAGASSILLWISIIFAGRMMAYNWFDCDRQPQPAWVNWAAGCVVEAAATPATSGESLP